MATFDQNVEDLRAGKITPKSLTYLSKDEARRYEAALPGVFPAKLFRTWYTLRGSPYNVGEKETLAANKALVAASTPTPASSVTGGASPATDYSGGTSVTNGNNNDTPPPASTGQPSGTGTALEQAAARQTYEAGQLYNMDTPAPAVPSTLRQPHRDIAVEAVKAYEQQKPVVAAQARKSQEGLDIALQAGIEYDAALRANQDRIQNRGESAAAAYDVVVEKAEGAAQQAAWNVGAGIREIEQWSTEIMDKLDANKARDVAVGVQATVDGMNEVDRQMQAQYGVDSDEYMQYKIGKANSLGSLLQNLQTTHANLTSQIGVQFAELKSKYKTEAEMYASFERQLATNMAKDMELAKTSLNMQVSQEIAGLEMLITANQENMANWIIETPVFGMDSSALIGFMGSLATEQWATDQAQLAAKRASDAAKSSGKMSMWGSIAGGVLSGGLLAI